MNIILTPNQRMARYLSQETVNSANNVYDVNIEVFPIAQWLEKTYSDLNNLIKNPINLEADQSCGKNCFSLLSEDEELIVWERIISESEAGAALLKTTQTAKLARNAFYLCQQWKLNLSDGGFLSPDVTAYIEWSKSYTSFCEKNNYIETARLADVLIELLEQENDLNTINFSKMIHLMGFEELTPQLNSFFERLMQHGISVKHESLLSHNKNNVMRLKAQDSETEYRLAAQAAKLFLISRHCDTERSEGEAIQEQEFHKNINLHKTYKHTMAIVVPNLNEERDKIIRILTEILPKDSFNVAAPKSLASYPIIQSAMLTLSLPATSVSMENLSQVLASPFLGEALNEMSDRAAFDIYLREMNEPTFYWQTILEMISEKPGLFNFKKLLTDFLLIQTQFKGKKTTEEWCLLILELLKAFDWPGQRTLTSTEYQIKACFEAQLEAYKQLGRVLGKHTYWQATSRIRESVMNTPFAPQSADASIQVLGVLEALGLPFDKIWVTGLHRGVWPEESRPNPFIPIPLQRAADAPRSSAQRELRVAKRSIEQLSLAASEVIFSYPTMVNEEAMHQSPLISHFPETSIEALSLSKPESALRLNSLINPKCFIPDESAPKVNSTEKNLGGTSMLKLQAICPFRAFAEIRLKARAFPLPTLGLHPAERGVIIHEILHDFYMQIPHQLALKSLTEEALTEKISFSVRFVLEAWQKKKPKTLTTRYLKLEFERINTLMHRLIALDKERSPFSIIQQEKEVTISLSDIQLKIRIDRVDKLDSGEEILIDYKTSDIALSHWFSERSEEPQLPLYSITRDSPVAGLVFAIIHPEKTQYLGLTKEQNCIPGARTIDKFKSSGAEATWEIQHEKWQNSLSKLAGDFSQGIATIDPKHGEQSCRYCHLKPLCRIDLQI